MHVRCACALFDFNASAENSRINRNLSIHNRIVYVYVLHCPLATYFVSRDSKRTTGQDTTHNQELYSIIHYIFALFIRFYFFRRRTKRKCLFFCSFLRSSFCFHFVFVQISPAMSRVYGRMTYRVY